MNTNYNMKLTDETREFHWHDRGDFDTSLTGFNDVILNWLWMIAFNKSTPELDLLKTCRVILFGEYYSIYECYY